MNTNLSVEKTNPSFGIKISRGFQSAVHNYFNGVEYRPWRSEKFDRRACWVDHNFGYDEFTLEYHKVIKDGITKHRLTAEREGMKPVLISEKDQFRKLIEKFQRMKKGELYIKIKQAKAEQGITDHSL